MRVSQGPLPKEENTVCSSDLTTDSEVVIMERRNKEYGRAIKRNL